MQATDYKSASSSSC